PTNSAVPRSAPAAFSKPPLLPRAPAAPPRPSKPSGRRVARIVDDHEASLLDLLDNLLAKGVVLNADLILALANVDLVYVRLSALICAADRVLGSAARRGPVTPQPRSGAARRT